MIHKLSSKQRSCRLRFPEQVKNSGWRISRDEIGDEKVLLTKDGDGDHLYPMSRQRFGVWLSRAKISRLIDKLKKIDGCTIEQLGDCEAVLSFPYKSFNKIAGLLHAAKKKNVSPKLRSYLTSISPFSSEKSHVQGANKRLESANGCDCISFAGQVLLAIATDSCDSTAKGKAWKVVELLLSSYAARRAV